MSRSRDTGFTMVEIVVMMAIMAMISGMVLVSFGGLHEGAALNRSARELGLAIRRSQNIALSITRVDTGAGPQIPKGAGIRLTQGSSRYILFADQTRDNKYDTSTDPPDAKIEEEHVFEGNVTVESLKYFDALNNPLTTSVAHVVFSTPNADMFISDESGASLGETLQIVLRGPSGKVTKKVTVRISGQVSIQ